MNKIKNAIEQQQSANKCYLIDEQFCKTTQKRIAGVMGLVASLPDSNDANAEILDELAEIRSFFQKKDLRDYSDNLKNSIDMERFINPGKPVIQ